MSRQLDARISDLLVCPDCKGKLRWNAARQELWCRPCMKAFPVVDQIPAMVLPEARDMTEQEIQSLEKTES